MSQGPSWETGAALLVSGVARRYDPRLESDVSQKRRRRERKIHPGEFAYIVSEGSLYFALAAGQVAVYEGRFRNGKRVTNSRADGCTPRFRLKDGKVLHGHDCWWVPFRKAIAAAKAMGSKGEVVLNAARSLYLGH